MGTIVGICEIFLLLELGSLSLISLAPQGACCRRQNFASKHRELSPGIATLILCQEAMDETFLLTNIAPQVGDGFNRHCRSIQIHVVIGSHVLLNV